MSGEETGHGMLDSSSLPDFTWLKEGGPNPCTIDGRRSKTSQVPAHDRNHAVQGAHGYGVGSTRMVESME